MVPPARPVVKMVPIQRVRMQPGSGSDLFAAWDHSASWTGMDAAAGRAPCFSALVTVMTGARAAALVTVRWVRILE
jgi:hypothetical protein